MKNRYLYFCPKCHNLGSAEHTNPTDYQECSDCKSKMVYTGITKTEWDSKTREEKDKIKAVLNEIYPISNSESSDSASLIVLNRINDNLSTIKNIMIFYLVVSIIGFILSLLF